MMAIIGCFLDTKWSIEQCGAMVEHWTARPGNTYLRVHIGCEEVSIVEESNAPREM